MRYLTDCLVCPKGMGGWSQENPKKEFSDMYIKYYRFRPKPKERNSLGTLLKLLIGFASWLVAERKEEGDFKYDLKALRQNGENTEVQKALEKKQCNFTKKKRIDVANICILYFTTYWVYFINKRWFAVKFCVVYTRHK